MKVRKGVRGGGIGIGIGRLSVGTASVAATSLQRPHCHGFPCALNHFHFQQLQLAVSCCPALPCPAGCHCLPSTYPALSLSVSPFPACWSLSCADFNTYRTLFGQFNCLRFFFMLLLVSFSVSLFVDLINCVLCASGIACEELGVSETVRVLC